MLRVVLLNLVMLSVVLLNLVMLSVVMLDVVMLSVVAPFFLPRYLILAHCWGQWRNAYRIV